MHQENFGSRVLYVLHPYHRIINVKSRSRLSNRFLENTFFDLSGACNLYCLT